MSFMKVLAFLTLIIAIHSNINSTFAATRTWTGAVDTNWGTAGNWNGGLTIPASGDDVIVPAGCTNYPVLSSNITIKSLTINQNASLTQNSGTLLIKGGATSINGTYSQNGGTFLTDQTLSINSTGTLSISGTLNLADDVAKNPSDHIVINGTVNQVTGVLRVKDFTINTGGSYTSNGTILDVYGNFKNYSSVTLNGGDVTIMGQTNNYTGANMVVAGANIILQDNAFNYGNMSLSSGSFNLNSAGKKLTIDGGTFTQSGGTVLTKDMELKNGGTYNQSNGEFQISHDLKVPSGNTFNGTGGTVQFTGAAGGGADYTGNVQFHNLSIDAGADYNLDNNSDNIKISGNYTNNNPNLDNDQGTLTFNGTTPQTIYSSSTPASSKTAAANLVVSNPSGVSLLTDLGLQTSFSYNSGGYLNLNGNTLYVNGSVYGGPLPVELSSFSGVILENGIKLKWRTETEVSNYGFEIHRSTEHNDWNVIGFVEGYGNSNSPKDYSFVDENVLTGTYAYRLKQIDTDGKFEYSKIVEVDLGSPVRFELKQNYPNPFNPTTAIRFTLSETAWVKLIVYNSAGEKVRELVNSMTDAGIHIINFNGEKLSSGVYLYVIQIENILQTKKMILMK